MNPLLPLFLALVMTLGLRAAHDHPPQESEEPIRGVVISCQTFGREWGSDEMVEAMQEVKALGANWIQIHPYGTVQRDGTIRFGRGMSADDEAPQWLSRPIAEAHRLGLKICITPHIAPWRAGWDWRGDITFETKAQQDTFFREYEQWITRLARFCRDADGFTVGSELDQMLNGREQEWRQIIAAVRAETDAALTYAANWPDYKRVKFWDALDVISISAYFPVAKHDGLPTVQEIDESWQRIRRQVLDYAATQNRRVVFMELGYDKSLRAAIEPWKNGHSEPGAEALQTLCLDRALLALEEPDDLLGSFLWKWFPGNSRGEDFLVSTPAMREVVARHWQSTRSSERVAAAD
jgi:hypothetical protein